MKALKKTVLGAAMALALAGGAQAAVISYADMAVYSLGFALGTPGTDYTLTILSESRTGTAASNYNGVEGTGAGLNSITTNVIGAQVDVANRCAGDCVGAASLYVGGMENSLIQLSSPASANYAMGDMFISGSALGGNILGLTRADAQALGPTNLGGSSATILNSGRISGVFTVGSDYTTPLALGVAAFMKTWVDLATPQEQAFASAGFGWNMSIYDNTTQARVLNWNPDELNFSAQTSLPGENFESIFDGFLTSDVVTFLSDRSYRFTINQSSNVTISDIPEPGSLALAGLGLLGLGALRRRKAK